MGQGEGVASFTKRGDRWRVQVRRRGHKPACKTFRTKREAQEWARDLEARIDKGTIVSPSKAITVADLIHAYRELRETARPIQDTANEHYMLQHLAEGLGDKRAHGLSAKDLVHYARDRRAQGAGPYTVLMEVSKLGTVWKYAGVGLGLPDVVGQARPLLNHAGLIGSGGKRERRPTEDELRRILEAIPAPYRPLIQMMTAIGVRRGEVCRLRWEDLDRERKLILVRDRKDPRAKKGNDQWVPLIRGAWEMVIAAPQLEEPMIFPIHPQTLSKVFKMTCDALGIVDLHLHDLRHEAISQMFESGMTIEQVALVSGHRDWKNLKRYVQLRPESLHCLPVSGPNTRSRP